jgi:CBS domain-containing protein
MALLVRHAMTEAPKQLPSSMTADNAAGIMANYDVGAVPVVDEDGSLVGLVTDRDLVVRVLANRMDPHAVRLADVATKHTVTATPDMSVSDARALMAEHRVRRLPVMKGEELVGIISLGDVAMASSSARAVGEALEEVSDSPETESRNAGPDPGTPPTAARG